MFAKSRVLLVLVLVFIVACGGTTSASTTAASTPRSDATRSDTTAPERPRADQGLSTGPRSDAPPFPASDLRPLIGPLGQPMPRERLIALAMFIRWYERDPFDPRIGMELDLSVRATLLAWLTESPDVSVTIVSTVSAAAQGRGAPLTDAQSSHITVGGILGMAADAIEHPERDPQSAERQAAGIESGLRWYQAAVARGGERSVVADEFVQMAGRGELAEWFSTHITIH